MHLWKNKYFRTTLTQRKDVSEEYIKKFMVRQPAGKLNRMHPAAKKIYNKMIEQPQPLQYSLQDIPLKQKEYFWEISNPIGNAANIPFMIARTHTNNLPVYADYNHDRSVKRTIIRHVEGDIEEFKKELSKIVSNAQISTKTGKIIVTGLHAAKVKLWLRRLGF
jgi:large subunit ribosomal protein L49